MVNSSKEKSFALFSQFSLISKHFEGVKNFIHSITSSTFAPSGIKIPVFLSITLSFNHHSFTHKTGFPADILSTGLIQKSSSIGI
ncbi:MAG: hypothetical protein LBQ24_00690 [Candidatus Peribacteria bacterium]|nr:hypothetical protein [Candidatus Peribacteria bacterium]